MSARISSGGQTPPERSSTAASLDRRIQMLRTAMGPVIAAALADPDVVEIMLCQRVRRTAARASAKVGSGFAYQLACRGEARSAGQC